MRALSAFSNFGSFLLSSTSLFSLSFSDDLASRLGSSTVTQLWDTIHQNQSLRAMTYTWEFWALLTVSLLVIGFLVLWALSSLHAEELELISGFVLRRNWRGQPYLFYVGTHHEGREIRFPNKIIEVWNNDAWVAFKQKSQSRTSFHWLKKEKEKDPSFFFLLDTKNYQLEGPFLSNDFLIRIEHAGIQEAKVLLSEAEKIKEEPFLNHTEVNLLEEEWGMVEKSNRVLHPKQVRSSTKKKPKQKVIHPTRDYSFSS